MPAIKVKVVIFIMLCGIFWFSCNAPRNNPVDPLNKENQLGMITGRVQTLSIPHLPLEDASVHWINGDAFVYTNGEGEFSIANTKRDNGQIVIEKEGYQTDTVLVDWNNEKSFQVESSLNFIPVVDSIAFYSTVLNRRFRPPDYSLEAKLLISDLDNDIDTVFMTNPTQGFVGVMDYNTLTKFYIREFSLDELGIESANEIIGKDFQIIVKDTRGQVFELGNTNVKRVINEAISTQSPKNYDTVSVPFNLAWQRFEPGFNFYYQLEIYTKDLDPEIEWQRTAILQQNIDYQVESPIRSGEYFWVIWCIDEFGNKSRSLEASFIIE